MNKLAKCCVFAALTGSISFDVAAQGKPIAYPAKGQSQQQQQQDDGACYSWAKSNTGVDPAAMGSAPPPPS
ncbi:MAG: hypothetical protein WCA53_11525, partial [Caballeronia sp.]